MAAKPRRKRALETPPSEYRAGWLESLDHRTQIAQEMRGRFLALAADLGGLDNLSYLQRSLAERLLWIEHSLAQAEQAIANGQPFDVGTHTQAVNTLIGIANKLGIQRQAKPLSLKDVLEQEAAK